MDAQHFKPDFRRFHLVLNAMGIRTAPLYRQLGIHSRDWSGEGPGVPMVKFHRLLALAADQFDPSSFGAVMGKRLGGDDLGVLSHMIRNAPTFATALHIIQRYLALVSPGAVVALKEDGKTCVWTYDYEGVVPEQCRYSVEATLVQFTDMVRQVAGSREWTPAHVWFRHEQPDRLSPLGEELGGGLEFDHYFSGVAFPTSFLALPISNADPALLAILERQVQTSLEALDARRDLAGRVAFLVSSGLGKTDTSVEAIAREIGMSRRTLHRRLARIGTSFQEVRDTTLEHVAKELLVTTRASMTEIALQLGYADPSAFSRGFKRLAGTAPLQFRMQHRKEP